MMIGFVKRTLSPKLGSLALSLLTLSLQAAQPAPALANLPLYFEANSGQFDAPARFAARGHDFQFLISPAEAQIVLRKAGAGAAVVRMQFAGASAQAQVRGDTELPGKINYLIGNNPARWHTDVATFAKVQVGELYPGVSLVYYGNQQQLEYDFTIAPGAKPDAIAMHFTGVNRISVSPRGELVLSLASGEIRQPKPVIYQTDGGARKQIEGGYRLLDPHTVAFSIGSYDRTLPLIIDPVLSYSTYFGGTSGESATAVAVNTNDGSIYITGRTLSPSLATPGAFQTTSQNVKGAGDAFVARFNNQGTSLIYLTYLGGNDDDQGFGIAVDAAGNAYVTGYTVSVNFPVFHAMYPTLLGSADAFVAELNPTGSGLIYSTYLGGSGFFGDTVGTAIALDSLNSALVTGFTYSSNFPITANAFQKKLACTNSYINANAFVAKIGPGGSPLVYSTYLGGNNWDGGSGIAVDSSNFFYVTGLTSSTNFPNINSFQKNLNGSVKRTSDDDAFVAKFDSTGSNLVYSSYLGGTNNDFGQAIAVDNHGAAYVTGYSISTNYPNTQGAVLPDLYSYVATNTRNIGSATNVFLTKITNGTQAGIDWSVLFGGSRVDVGWSVAVDPAGNVFVTGSTSSTNFPCSPTNAINNLISTNAGKSDAFVTAVNSNGTALLYSLRLGGKDADYGYAIAVDPLGNAYVVGATYSTNFPAVNAYQAVLNGTNDTFLAKILLTPPAPPALAFASSSNNVVVTWPASPFEPESTNSIKLESNTNLLSPGTWVLVPQPPVLTNGAYTYQFNPTNPAQFFRLQQF